MAITDGIKISALPKVQTSKLDNTYLLSYVEENTNQNYQVPFYNIREKIAKDLIDQEFMPNSEKAQSGKAIADMIESLDLDGRFNDKADITWVEQLIQEIYDNVIKQYREKFTYTADEESLANVKGSRFIIKNGVLPNNIIIRSITLYPSTSAAIAGDNAPLYLRINDTDISINEVQIQGQTEPVTWQFDNAIVNTDEHLSFEWLQSNKEDTAIAAIRVDYIDDGISRIIDNEYVNYCIPLIEMEYANGDEIDQYKVTTKRFVLEAINDRAGEMINLRINALEEQIKQMLTEYLTKQEAGDIYLTIENAVNNYLTKKDAADIYLTIENAVNNYLTKKEAEETYLTEERANEIYLRGDVIYVDELPEEEDRKDDYNYFLIGREDEEPEPEPDPEPEPEPEPKEYHISYDLTTHTVYDYNDLDNPDRIIIDFNHEHNFVDSISLDGIGKILINIPETVEILINDYPIADSTNDFILPVSSLGINPEWFNLSSSIYKPDICHINRINGELEILLDWILLPLEITIDLANYNSIDFNKLNQSYDIGSILPDNIKVRFTSSGDAGSFIETKSLIYNIPDTVTIYIQDTVISKNSIQSISNSILGLQSNWFSNTGYALSGTSTVYRERGMLTLSVGWVKNEQTYIVNVYDAITNNVGKDYSDFDNSPTSINIKFVYNHAEIHSWIGSNILLLNNVPSTVAISINGIKIANGTSNASYSTTQLGFEEEWIPRENAKLTNINVTYTNGNVSIAPIFKDLASKSVQVPYSINSTSSSASVVTSSASYISIAPYEVTSYGNNYKRGYKELIGQISGISDEEIVSLRLSEFYFNNINSLSKPKGSTEELDTMDPIQLVCFDQNNKVVAASQMYVYYLAKNTTTFNMKFKLGEIPKNATLRFGFVTLSPKLYPSDSSGVLPVKEIGDIIDIDQLCTMTYSHWKITDIRENSRGIAWMAYNYNTKLESKTAIVATLTFDVSTFADSLNAVYLTNEEVKLLNILLQNTKKSINS